MSRLGRTWFVVVLGAFGVACGDDTRGDGGTRDAARDAPRSDTGAVVDQCVAALPVDILWVIDNSHSMREEQDNLAANFEALIEVLTNPPDLDRDGEADFPKVEDLRLGVITTDMGVGDNAVGFNCTPAGDSGALIGTSRSADGACSTVSLAPPFLDYGGGSSTQVASQFSCLARLGTTGCGLEQQLEAALAAVTDRAASGQPNAGFLRPDSLLAIVFLTDEDDCSASDLSVFDPTPDAATRLGAYGVRCANHPEFLHSTDRYVQAFKGLRLDRRGDVVVAAITGVPRDLVTDPNNVNFDALLADPRMQFRPHDTDMGQLAPACELGGAGSAVPARRIIEVVKAFSADGEGLVQSICSTDLRPSMQAIGRLIGKRVCPLLI